MHSPDTPTPAPRTAMLYHRVHFLSPRHEWAVFVHGAGGSSSIWFRQVRAFRKHFNVLLVDLRGHGNSNALPPLDAADYTFPRLAHEIVEVMDHRGIRDAHLVGISLGCILIRQLCEAAPARVRSMVLGGAVARLDLRSRFLVRVGDAFKRVVPYLWLYRLFAWIIMPRERHRESRLLFVNEARKLCQKEFLRWFRLTLEINPLLRLFETREGPVPTLYLMGAEDHMFLPTVRRVVAQHTRWTQLQVIADAGHVCNVDQADRFNRLSIAFLRDAVPRLRPAP